MFQVLPRYLLVMLFCSVFLSTGLASLIAEEDPKQMFENLFGMQMKQVAATPETADDLQLAELILTVVEGSLADVTSGDQTEEMNNQKRLLSYFCEQAMALAGRDPKGTQVSSKSKSYLGKLSTDPTQTIKMLDMDIAQKKRLLTETLLLTEKKIIGYELVEMCMEKARLYQQMEDTRQENAAFLMGLNAARSLKLDNVAQLEAAYKKMKARQLSDLKMKQYVEALKKNPDDEVAATSLFYHYVLNRDQPQKIKSLLPAIKDERLLGAGELLLNSNREPEAHLELARWYIAAASKSQIDQRGQVYQTAYDLTMKFKAVKPDHVMARVMEKQLVSLLEKYGLKVEPAEPAVAVKPEPVKPIAPVIHASTDSLIKGLVAVHDFEFRGPLGNYQSPLGRADHRHLGWQDRLLNAFPRRSVKHVQGRYGKGVRFNGENYLESNAERIDLRQASTLALWINMENGNGVLSQEDDYYLNYNQTSKDFRWYGEDIWRFKSIAVPTKNKWLQLLLVNDGETQSLYINGRKIPGSSRRQSNREGKHPEVLFLGKGKDDYRFVGVMDELLVWERALNSQEIRLFMDMARRGSYAAPLADAYKKAHPEIYGNEKDPNGREGTRRPRREIRRERKSLTPK